MFQLREVTPTPGTTTSPKDAAGKKEQLSTSTPNHGEVWLAVLDPGGPGGTRPVLVVSTDAFNAWPVGLVIVAPRAERPALACSARCVEEPLRRGESPVLNAVGRGPKLPARYALPPPE